jgi:Bacterial PH domain
VPEPDTQFVDEPRPGRGYLVFMSVLALGALSLLGFVAITARDEPILEQLAATLLFFVPLVVLLSIPFHAAYRTRYEFADDALRLRSGFVIKAALEYHRISTVEQVGFIHRVLGWGGGRGIANRFTNGLELHASGKTYFISPTDPEAFAAEIERRGAAVLTTR